MSDTYITLINDFEAWLLKLGTSDIRTFSDFVLWYLIPAHPDREDMP
jgi:hypothetical protein